MSDSSTPGSEAGPDGAAAWHPSGSRDRDFGDSAGYGSGGSALDYRDVGDIGAAPRRPNPLDAVMDTRLRRGSGSRNPNANALAQGLGWFSIGLGLAEIAAPQTFTRFLGMRGREGLVRAYGVREVAAGVGILASKDPTAWIWGRVAGDALDIGTVVTGLDDRNPKKGNVAFALVALAGVTALDVLCAERLSRTSD